MLSRMLGWTLLLATLPASSSGQAAPVLSKVPTAADTQISGTAQGFTPPYAAILLYVCASPTVKPPLNCSTEDLAHGRKRTLVNLGGTPFSVTTADGTFTIAIPKSLAAGTYIWITQIARTHHDKEEIEIATTSNPVRVPVPLLSKASISLSGYDSASRDVGAKVTLDLRHGLQNEGLGQTLLLTSVSYDDKWKAKPFSSNVTQNYSAKLSQLKQLGPSTAWGPYARVYHNNTQGIRVEQTYGVGVTQIVKATDTYALSMGVGMQAMLENLFTPGNSTTLGGVHMSAEIDRSFGTRTSIDVKLEGTPVFTQGRAWTASGDFDLEIPISRRWSIKFEVVDNYYEIAPKTFNKNYLGPAIGLSFK